MMNVSVARERRADELAYQRGYQPRRLRQADADHHHEDDRHRREVAEVRDERGEEVSARRRPRGDPSTFAVSVTIL